MHSNVTIKNVSWPHFSWPTLYMYINIYCISLLSGVVVSINEVNLRRARLVPRWVTVSGFNSRWWTDI